MLNINLSEIAKGIEEAAVTEVRGSAGGDIAVIGISLKLPMAENTDAFWSNLAEGRDCITDLPGRRKEEANSYFRFKGRSPEAIKYKKGSYLDRLDEFDCSFFNISPGEAALMDPNQRMFLETALKAFEDAGCDLDSLRGSRTGVYFGFVSDLAYQRLIADVDPSSVGSAIPGNMASIIPGRVSYALDLKGPSMLIDTACSSSLVAIHTACCALRSGDCDMALAGSSKMSLLPVEDENMLGIESKKYVCRAFDDDSDGTCMGEGLIAVVLKPLSKALRDRDNIYAVIKGSAINQDGRSMGITAPNALAQAEVIENAWRNAGVDPETITYIEAHGTGTRLGDPVEIDGITRAFRKFTDRKQFCAVGSVKTNLGHLDSAAGMAGFIKAVLALKHGMIPPSINFSRPNRDIDFENSPVYVNSRLRSWENGDCPRRCGVSAFGLSGTNCHIVLEEAPVIASGASGAHGDASHMLALSAKSAQGLSCLIRDYRDYLDRHSEIQLGDLCFTAGTGRSHYSSRISIIAMCIRDLKEKLTLLSEVGLRTLEEKGIYYNELAGAGTVPKARIKELLRDGDRAAELKELCRLYVNGAEFNWYDLSKGNFRKISLPTYPFERRRCFIEIPSVRHCPSYQAERKAGTGQSAPVVKEAPDTGEEYSAEPAEKRIARIWAEVLGFEAVGADDNFYDLGGDSIIAMKIVNRLRKELAIDMEVTDLLASQTVGKLASCLTRKRGDGKGGETGAAGVVGDVGAAGVVEGIGAAGTTAIAGTTGAAGAAAIMRAEKASVYPLSSAQTRIFILGQLEGIGTSYNIPLAVAIEGSLDGRLLEDCFRTLVKRHEVFRTSFEFIEGEPVQRVHDTVDFTVEFIESDKRSTDSLIKDFVRPFRLDAPPLLRVRLVKVEEERHVLLVDLHHIIGDGMSLGILIKEFICLYEGRRLPEPRIQYKDYAVWQKENAEAEAEKHEAYWTSLLEKELPVLNMPLDFKRTGERTFSGARLKYSIPAEKVREAEKLCRSLGMTLNTFVLSVYSLLVGKYGGQEEVIIGTTVSGRQNADLDDVIGAFINFLPLRIKLDGGSSFVQHLDRVRACLYSAFEHQSYPFERMAEKAGARLDPSHNPIFDTMLIFHNENEFAAMEGISVGNIRFSACELDYGASTLDFKLDAYPLSNGELLCALEYNTDLFAESTMNLLIHHFERLFDMAAGRPDCVIDEIALFTADEQAVIEEKRKLNRTEEPLAIAICASFTAEPLADYVTWWCGKFGIEADVSFAPYNQVFQQLMDPDSLMSKNNGLNLLLVRFEDWIRDASGDDNTLCALLDDNFNRLVEALKHWGAKAPWFAAVFPVATHLGLSDSMIGHIQSMYSQWRKLTDGWENAYALDFTELHRLYGLKEIFDLKKDLAGHLPFSDEFYAAAGTFAARRICAWKRQRFKVAVLDCDNTLWRGICGEDGELGVIVDADFAALQNFMLDKYNKGMLLAICSKNNEQDVWRVFENNPGMILKKEHFAAWRINWQPKPENLKALSEELNLGLDSFIFLDDSPVECAAAMKECPSVLAVQLPEDTGAIPAFLSHIWAFDILKVTAEDRSRTQMYLTEKKRQEMQETRPSLQEFIESLQLVVSFNPMEKSQLERVAQLTQRTNQFNLSTIRRTENEILALLDTPANKCWVVEAADRFGAYGLTGVVITREEGRGLLLDTLLLSCRVLGREVENTLLCCLGRYAREVSADYLEARYCPTQKNGPVREFLEKTGWEAVSGTSEYTAYRMDIAKIPDCNKSITCCYMTGYKKEGLSSQAEKPSYQFNQNTAEADDSEKASADCVEKGFEGGLTDEKQWETYMEGTEALYHRNHLLALGCHSGEYLLKLPVYKSNSKKPISTEYAEPENEVEEKLAAIWQSVLGTERIGIDDNFFELGGHSLKAVTIASRIYRELKADIPMSLIFKASTIRKLAERIGVSDSQIYSRIEQAPAREHFPLPSFTEVFNHPTVSKLAKAADSYGAKTNGSIEPAGNKKHYVLSSAQKRIFLLNCLETGSIAYNETAVVAIEGNPDRGRLKEAFGKLIQRHDALRTSFEIVDDVPVQIVHRNVNFEIDFMEAVGNKMPDDKVSEALSGFIRPFSLDKAPLVRVGLIKVSGEKNILVCDIHHIISDEASMEILVKEFILFYGGGELPGLRVQYKDFSEWQCSLFEQGAFKQREEYWLNRFSDLSDLPDFPTDFPRTRLRSFEGDGLDFEIGGLLFQQVCDQARDAKVTYYMFLLAVYNVLLNRYTGREDIIVGSPVSGRTHADLENIIGMFASTLAIRNYPGVHKTFEEFLCEVKENCLGDFENQDYPLEDLVDKLHLPRNPNRNPLFDTVFSYHRDGEDETGFHGLRFSRYEYKNKAAKFDLTLHVYEGKDRLRLRFEFCTALFLKETVEKLARDYIKILERAVDCKSIKISEIMPLWRKREKAGAITEDIEFNFDSAAEVGG